MLRTLARKSRGAPLVPQAGKRLDQEAINLLQRVTIRSVWKATARRTHILSKTVNDRVWVNRLEELELETIGSLMTIGMNNSIGALQDQILERLRGPPKYLNRIPSTRKDVLGIRGKDVEVAIKKIQNGPSARTNQNPSSLSTSEPGNQSTSHTSQPYNRPRRRAAARNYRLSPEIEGSHPNDLNNTNFTCEVMSGTGIGNQTYSPCIEASDTDDEGPLPPKKRYVSMASTLRRSKRVKISANTAATDSDSSDGGQIMIDLIRKSLSGISRNNPKAVQNKTKPVLVDEQDTSMTAPKSTGILGGNPTQGSPARKASEPTKEGPSIESKDILSESMALRNLANSHLAASRNIEKTGASLDKGKCTCEERIDKLTEEINEIKKILMEVNGTMGALLAFCKGQDL
ncbi:hypothetical protein TWF718_006797 [Orbilia javanica]|uniref:Uncharacterized protein n=1 Tax=Orbilia javanica TaxID=47235 RepID=A0AAN8RHQ9_9PEZI